MPIVNEKECRHAGIDPNIVRRIANGIERYAKEAQKYCITIYGGSTCGSMRFSDDRDKTPLILATNIIGYWDGGDGGDGGDGLNTDGLKRGE